MKKILLFLGLSICFLFVSPSLSKADGDGHEAGYLCQSANDCPPPQQTSGTTTGENGESSNQPTDSSIDSAILYLLTTALPKGW